MKANKIKGYLLVFIQISCVVIIFLTGRPIAYRPLLLVWECAGFMLGTWAVAVMGIHNFNVIPEVKDGAHLVTTGPYRFIRHPMYASVLFIIWPLIIDQYSLWRLITGLVLTGDLIVKLLYEEDLLRTRFAEYEGYMRDTKRLIPFLY